MSEPTNDAPAGFPAVNVYQGLPDVEMVVTEGNTVSPSGEDVSYGPGEHVTVDGPTAIALAAGGYATPVSAAEAPADAPTDTADAEDPAE